MPRGRSSSSSSRSSGSSWGSSRSASPRNTTQSQSRGFGQRTQPTPTQTSQPPAQSGGMMSGIGSTIAQGMAFGAGSEVAHQAVRSVMGGNSHGNEQKPMENNQQQQQQQQQQPCAEYTFKFNDCLKFKDNDLSQCQSYFDDLKSCERSLI